MFSSSALNVVSGGDENKSVGNQAHFISPNVNDTVTLKRAFLKQHPIQMHCVQGKKFPFDRSNLYYRSLPSGEKVQRKWLSYSFRLNKVFFSTCIACSVKDNRESSFISGHEASFSMPHRYNSFYWKTRDKGWLTEGMKNQVILLAKQEIMEIF